MEKKDKSVKVIISKSKIFRGVLVNRLKNPCF